MSKPLYFEDYVAAINIKLAEIQKLLNFLYENFERLQKKEV